MNSLLPHLITAVGVVKALVVCAVIFLLISAYADAHLTPQKFWCGIGLVLAIVALLLALIWVYV